MWPLVPQVSIARPSSAPHLRGKGLTVLKTGHLCRSLSQGSARGQGCNRTCALHRPKAELEVRVATGRVAPPASDNGVSAQCSSPRRGPRLVLQQNLRTALSQSKARGRCCYRASGAKPAYSTFPKRCLRLVLQQVPTAQTTYGRRGCIGKVDRRCCGRIGKPVLPPGTAPAPPEE